MDERWRRDGEEMRNRGEMRDREHWKTLGDVLSKMKKKRVTYLRTDIRTYGHTDGHTDIRTDPLIEMRGRI